MKRILIFLFTFLSICSSQQLMVKTVHGTQSFPVSSSIDGVMAEGKMIVAENTGIKTSRYIVELTAPAKIEQRRLKLTSAVSQELQKDEVTSAIRKTIPQASIRREYSTIINGFAVDAAANDIASIRSMKGVKHVYADVKVNSTPFAKTTAAAQQTSSTAFGTGHGVKIGIIDTGIDYLHEALGQGFGNGFKIAGGYDFVNGDDDPMDDNGHGTHVAGIVAGESSTINSPAYGAELYAYKVLNAQGGGNASDVIAAIERAVMDSVEVINLSLGSTDGDPDDALCVAVNRAVEAGIVVVVAAGNTGDFGTINSPGMAKRALTVGAFDTYGIASFSAKGPIPSSYNIKPDIVAPGVGILSAKLGGGYVAMSGTSMAAPYVAGIAAVLREVHPDWNAEQIRDAIISQSKDIHQSLFAQGNGLVDEQQIFTSSVTFSPAHISFGFDTPSLTSWNTSDTVHIVNASGQTKHYEFTALSKNPAILLSFSPAAIDVPAGQTAGVVVTLTANNTFLGNNKVFSEGYTGTITAAGTDDTTRIPFTFFKGNVLQVKFNETPWQVVIHNQNNFSTTISPKTSSISLVVNEGTYDIMTSFYNSYFVVKENVDVSGHFEVMVDKSDAVYEVLVHPADEKGVALDTHTLPGTFNTIEGMLYKPKGFAIVGMSGGMLQSCPDPVKHFSPMSSRYSYGYSLNVQFAASTSYTYDISLDSGITASREFDFQPEDLRKVEMKYDADASVQRIFPISWTSFVTPTMEVSVTFYDGKAEPLTYPFIQTSYYSTTAGSFLFFHSREAYKY